MPECLSVLVSFFPSTLYALPSTLYNISMTVPANVVVEKRFTKLLTSIRRDMDTGLKEAQHLLNLARVQTYWKIGCSIAESFLDKDYRSAYRVSLYQKLGEELKLNERVLQKMVQFYRMYPQCPGNTPLTWTHYRHLISVADSKERLKLERRMIKEGVSSLQVTELVRDKNVEALHRVELKGGQLTCARGIPYLYAIRKGTDLNGVPFSPRLDLGFHVAIDSAEAGYIKFINSKLVCSIKEGAGYRLETYKGPSEVLYTYGAWIDRVVDGDTLVARIDMGYGMLTTQRLRLRAIDAPELSTLAGVKAKEYLTGRLKGVERVVVKTHKDPEKYGRYLTDLFVLEGTDDLARIAEEGVYVNQELLDKGLAGIYK